MNESPRERLLHAIDLALNREWGQAKTQAEAIDDAIADRLFLLFGEIEEREEARARHVAVVRHEIGNALSIAQANLEAMVDGVLEATNARLDSILIALRNASVYLEGLRHGEMRDARESQRVGSFDLSELVGAAVQALHGLALAKGLSLVFTQPESACTYIGSVGRVDSFVRELLLTTLRASEPGGIARITCANAAMRPNLVLDVDASIATSMNRSLKYLGFSADSHESDGRAVFQIELPGEAVQA